MTASSRSVSLSDHDVILLPGQRPAPESSRRANGVAFAGIPFVFTVPEAGNQGIGAALTMAPLLEAKALGYRISVLGASMMGEPVYRRLGFREYCRIGLFEWREG